eukprot:sb/3472987/
MIGCCDTYLGPISEFQIKLKCGSSELGNSNKVGVNWNPNVGERGVVLSPILNDALSEIIVLRNLRNSWHFLSCEAHDTKVSDEPTETSKQPIRTRYLGHVTGYQPIRDKYFRFRSVPDSHVTILRCVSPFPIIAGGTGISYSALVISSNPRVARGISS